MDKIDLKILAALQENARLPLRAVGDRVFLTPPAVSSRIEKLEKEKIITGYQAQIPPSALGYQIKAYISCDVDPSQKPVFYPYVKSVPNVMECDCVTGDYAMLLKVCFHTTQELDGFINQLQRFGKTRTQIVFSTSVEHRGIPVEVEEDAEASEMPESEEEN